METALESPSAMAAFAERGVIVPFTSPALTGARLRRTSNDGLRLTISGGAAVEWRKIIAAERITLHDRLLHRLLAADPSSPLTPRAAAAAALTAALTGAAGRAARRAAAITAQRQEEDRQITQFLLVARLLEELGVDGIDWRHLSPSDPAFHDWLIASAARLAPALAADDTPGNAPDQDGARLAAWLERLSAIVAPVGLPGGAYAPTSARTMEDLASFRDHVADFARTASEDAAEWARRTAEAAAQALELAAAAIDVCHADFSDLHLLHRNWPQIGEEITARCFHLDWLLDGWPAACLAWSEASANGAAAQGDALKTILRLQTPSSPQAKHQTPQAKHQAPPAKRRTPPENTPQPPCALADPMIVDKIYRNELLKAAAA